MSKQKWVIGIDLDGTTCKTHRPEHIINNRRVDYVHEETLDAIKKLQEFGHHIVIITGRNWLQAEPVYKMLGLNSFIINSAGGHIHHPYDNDFKDILEGIPNNHMKEILNDKFIMEKCTGWCVDKVNDTYMCANKNSILYKYGINEWKTTIFDGDFDFDPQSSVLYFDRTDEEVQEVVDYIRDKWGDTIHATNWGTTGGTHGGIELNPSTSNKGTALLKVAEILNVDKKYTMGFGDGENDLEMIKQAEHGVAMIQGTNYIKEHANHITTHNNDEGGVGIFLKEFFKFS